MPEGKKGENKWTNINKWEERELVSLEFQRAAVPAVFFFSFQKYSECWQMSTLFQNLWGPVKEYI